MNATTATNAGNGLKAMKAMKAMSGMNSLIKLEITRALRNRKFLFFSVIYPSALFLLIAGSADSTTKVDGSGLTLPTFFMVSMASFGALTAVLMGNSERIAKERESGWVRQLRLTTLPGRGYVFAKTASAAVISLPSIVVVFVVAAAVKDVRLDAWQWLALTGAIWAAASSSPRSASPSATWRAVTRSARSR